MNKFLRCCINCRHYSDRCEGIKWIIKLRTCVLSVEPMPSSPSNVTVLVIDSFTIQVSWGHPEVNWESVGLYCIYFIAEDVETNWSKVWFRVGGGRGGHVGCGSGWVLVVMNMDVMVVDLDVVVVEMDWWWWWTWIGGGHGGS